MNQPGSLEDHMNEEQALRRSPQTRSKQLNYSIGSEMSFNASTKKQKSKSFNRKQGTSQQQVDAVLSIYRQLQFSPQMRNLLKRFCYLDKQKLYKVSVTELKQHCERELKRFDFLRRNNLQIQRYLADEDLEDTDNELSLITITCQVKALVDAKNETNVVSNEVMTRTRMRQYENILLQVQKSDETIKNFINTRLKIRESSEININECKTFFKSQASQMSQSSDRIILSRRTLCEIVIFLCRLLQGQMLAYDDVYQYKEEELQSYQLGGGSNKFIVESRIVRNNQTIVHNLDHSFSDNNSQKEITQTKNQSQSRVYKDYSNDDLGKKVHQLAGICEQIPQLEAFTRTLKFSKITLENRESFFKIVDVIIALHHKIGYLSRNKPTLLREIETIQSDLTEVYESIREFVASLMDQVPKFRELQFKNQTQQDSKHQLTQTLSYLRKDLKRLSQVIKEQNENQHLLQEKIQLFKQIVHSFCQSIHQGDESLWRDFIEKLRTKNLQEGDTLIVNWLTECYQTIFNCIKNPDRPHDQMETERNLEAQVHTLLTDYERLRAEHQELQNKYATLIEQKDDHHFDIEERDKIITNLTAVKIAAEKRQKSLRDQILNAQEDARRYEQDLGILQEQLEIMSIENQNKMNDLLFEHQNEVKELVDKITNLQRGKMDILSKYQEECSKSIKLLQNGSSTNVQIQALKERLERKVKQNEQSSKRFKDTIYGLQKQVQQARNQKSLTQNKLQLAEKNKNKLMQKLQDVNSKHSDNIREIQYKYEEQTSSLKEGSYKLEKELDKFKRNHALLEGEIEHLKAELTAQTRSVNQYRQKLMQLNPVEAQYDNLAKEYQRLLQTYHKSQKTTDTFKQKCFDLTSKHQELLQNILKDKQLTRKNEKKSKDLQSKIQEIYNNHELADRDLKEQQKINKILQKKITDLQTQIDSLQQSLRDKDKNYSALIAKSQLKYQHLNDEQRDQLEKLRQNIRNITNEIDKKDQSIKVLEKQLKEQSNDQQLKDMDWTKSKSQLQKKLKEKDDQLQSMEGKVKSLQEQSYNQSIIIQEIKTEKSMYELKLTELQFAEKQKDHLRKNILNLEQNEGKLNSKIDKLQNQVQRLNEEMQTLKSTMREKERDLQNSQQDFHRKQREMEGKERKDKLKEQESRNSEISQLREQILVQKTIIIQENNKLHEQNNSLHDQIDKLRALNDALQKNIKKLQVTSNQAKQEFTQGQSQLKQVVSKHMFTITSLQNEIRGVNAERDALRRDYEEVQVRVESKSKQLSEKDNQVFERELQKSNLEKIVKELRLRNSQMQGMIETLNQAIQRLKQGKIKTLETEISQLNDTVSQWRRKEEQGREKLNDLQGEIQKVKRDSAKKLQGLKQEKSQLEEYYQNQLKKLSAQHQLQLSGLQNKTRKDTENEYNQLLIKEKETFNNLTISKIEQLGEMQRKYQKIIKDERSDKNALQEEYNTLQREFSEFKKTKNLSTSRSLIQEDESNTINEEMQKLRLQYELLKRQNTRLSQQNTRHATDGLSLRQQNAHLLSKTIESEHTITLLTSKLNLLTQNLQNTKKSLQEMNKIEIQKLNLQREVEKLKLKTTNAESRVNDYKSTIDQMEMKITETEGKLKEFRNKDSQWERKGNDNLEKIKVMTAQGNQMSQKIAQMKQNATQLTLKLTQKTQKLQTVETQLQAAEQKAKLKQNQLNSLRQQLEAQISSLKQQLSRKSVSLSVIELQLKQSINECELKQSALQQQGQKQLRKIKELQIELNQYKMDSHEDGKLVGELSKIKTYNFELQDKLDKFQQELNKVKTDKNKTERENQLLKQEIDQLNTDRDDNASRIIELEQQKSNLSYENDQLSRKLQELNREIKRLAQIHHQDTVNLQQQLIQSFENEKNLLLGDSEEVIKSLHGNLQKSQQKTNEITDKYKKALTQMDEINQLIEKLKRENMLLSDHCRKYQEKIQLLEISHKTNGQVNFQIQSKYLTVQNQKSKLQENNKLLEKQLQKQKEDFKALKQKNYEAQRDNQHLRNELASFQNNISGSNGQIQRLLNEIKTLQYQLQEESKQKQTIKTDYNRAQKFLEENQKQIGFFKNDNKQLHKKFTTTLQEIKYLQETTENLLRKLQESEGNVKVLKNQNSLLQQRCSQAESFIDQLNGELTSIRSKLSEMEGEKSTKQFQHKNLQSQLQTNKSKVSQLQSYLQQIENQKNQTQSEKQSQEAFQIQRLRTDLALIRQEILRLYEVIKRKEQDFDKQIRRLADEKASMWKDNQALAQEYQVLKGKFAQLEGVCQSKSNDLDRERQQKERLIQDLNQHREQMQILSHDFDVVRQEKQRLTRQMETLRVQVQRKTKQNLSLNQLLSQSKSKQQQLTRILITQETQVRRITNEIQTYKSKISTFNQQGEESNLKQNKLREEITRLEKEIARLQAELSITRMEYERLYGEHNKVTGQMPSLSQQLDSLNQQLQSLRQQNITMSQQLNRQKGESEKFYQQSITKQQAISNLRNELSNHKNEINRIVGESNSRSTIQANIKRDLQNANRQIVNMREFINRVQKQNHQLTIQLGMKEKMLKEMKEKVDKGNGLLELADREIKNYTEDKANLTDIIRELTKERDYYQLNFNNNSKEILTLRNTITILQKRISELKVQIQKSESNLEQQLSQSRSSINLVTKSFTYQGGHFTAADLNRLEEEIRRLVNETTKKDTIIQKDQYEIQRLNKEIKVLKEQIHLMSEGKTINIKGYTRVTNPNNTSLNTIGVIYTEYDLKEMRARMELLERNLAMYQDRESELLRQIEKFKFRERAHLQQIRVLSQRLRNNNFQSDLPPEITSMSSPKKTSFDQKYNRPNQAQSSTYRLQTGIQITQKKIGMTKIQNQKEKYVLRLEGEELRKTIQRISNSQQVMSSKIDEIIDSTRKVSRENLEQVLTSNQFNLSATIINEVRDLIHQNKALIETLQSLKHYRDDVSLLIQEYIDPELLTEFVFRILTYFSEVQQQSPEASQIRHEINKIRKENVGGYYFTMLEEYTKYILENNSIEFYKQELRQKARDLLIFKEKFQFLIDSKLDENQKLLNRQGSRNSLHKSRSRYNSNQNSRLISGSENSRQSSRIKEHVSNWNKASLQTGDNRPSQHTYPTHETEQKGGVSSKLGSFVVTVKEPQVQSTSSRIAYTPSNKQILTPSNNPIQSVTQNRIHVVYSATTSPHYFSNGTKLNNPSNVNEIRPSFQKK